LDNLLAKSPRIATLYDLLGGIHYLRKDSTRALEAFKRSLDLDPSNAETSRLVEKLNSFQGRIPADNNLNGE
jgi:lipoprotein NlpI